MIKVVGLGCKDGDLSLKGAVAIDNADVVICKTALTDTYKFFEEEGIQCQTLDAFYDSAEDFEQLDNNIAQYLAAMSDKNVVYCVDGNGADDRSVKKLAEICNVQIIPGVSRELSVLQRHPFTGVVKVSAYDIAGDKAFCYDKTLPLVICDIDNAYIAGEVKEALSRLVGDECEIIFFDGTAECTILAYELDRQAAYGYQTGVCCLPQDICDMQQYNYGDLLRIMYKLRGRNGCEWDKAQTHGSIRGNMIEEAYELVEAINNEDIDNIIEEAGDVILQGVFHAVIGEDEGEFEANEVLTNLCKKLVTRHTHIFGDVVANNAAEALSAWEAAKAKEKSQQTATSKIQGVAKALPSLQKAAKYQKYLAKMGMDFENQQQLQDKIVEELREVLSSDGEAREVECGDLLFAVVNLLRSFGVDGEVALGKASDKFAARVKYIEDKCNDLGVKLNRLTAEQQDELWNEAKANENR